MLRVKELGGWWEVRRKMEEGRWKMGGEWFGGGVSHYGINVNYGKYGN